MVGSTASDSVGLGAACLCEDGLTHMSGGQLGVGQGSGDNWTSGHSSRSRPAWAWSHDSGGIPRDGTGTASLSRLRGLRGTKHFCWLSQVTCYWPK